MTKSELIQNIKSLDKPGRDKFKQLCKKLSLQYDPSGKCQLIQYFEPSNEKLAYDCGFFYNGKKYIVELKDRDPKYEKYDEFILEKDKAERLVKWKNSLEAHKCYYVNFFGENIYIFDIDEKTLQMPSKRLWMNAVTADPATPKIEKEVIMLPKSIAKKFSL